MGIVILVEMTTIGTVSQHSSALRAVPQAQSMRGRVAASSELDRLEKQLSDWVNCASAKTSAGRAKIAEISGKIGAVKARSEHVESDAALTSANANANAKAKAQGTTMILDSPRQREGLGNTLDVFA